MRLFCWITYRNYYSAVDGKPTNNVAEIEGATYAINFLGDKDFQSVSLRTDSKFLVTSYYQYMDTWIENDWIRSNGSPVKNREQFEDLNAAIEYHNMDVVFLHVAAHSGNRFNDEADRLASFGVEEYRERYH